MDRSTSTGRPTDRPGIAEVTFGSFNRLEYETYQRVTTALPNAAPGAEGGLPTCDGQNRVTTANPASVSNVNIETENTVIQS